MKIPRWLVKHTPNFVLGPIRPIAGWLLSNIDYSRDYYEKDYHSHDYRLPEKDLDSVIKRFVDSGQKRKLYEALKQIRDIPEPKNWLEIGCQFGKSAFWLAEYYAAAKFFMFDFSETAIDFIKRNNTIPERSVVWRGDVIDIREGNNSFDEFFEFASILDLTEHLPKDVYFKCIKEANRVLKPGAFILLKQGNEILKEHINIRWEWQLVRDFKNAGFRLTRRLPNRHYLLKKPG